MEALALLDIDQEDDNLLIASSLEENESNAEEEPLLILSVSPPSPSLVSCKKKRLEALGDLQNCRAGSYIHSARQQRHEISSPEKIEEEPVVLRRNRSRRLMTLRKSLAWDKAFFTDEGEICNYEESNRCGCKNGYLSSTPEFNFISTFCFLYFVSCCFHLSLGPTASLPSISKSFAGTSKDNRDCNLVISSVVHQVHVSSSCDKTLWQSSIDRMDTGNTAGRGPITSAVHSQQHVHTSGKPFALPKRPRGLPTVPAVKDPIKRVDSSAAFGSDTTIKGVFNVRNLFHAKDTSSATCTASKMQVPSIPRSKSATPPPGLVKCLPGSIQDAMLPPAEAFHTGKPSGLRKPSPKLGFFDSVPNHSSIGMHSRIPSKDTGGSNSRLQGLFLGKGRSPISYAPHLQSDVASVPATPRACLTSPATPQGSSSKSTRLPVRKGLPGYKNCSGSVCRELMSETPQLNGKRPQSDISDSKTVNMAMQATDSSLKLPNAQFNKLDRPDFESANDILCLPEPHHAQASALCAECDAKCLQCRFIPETEGVDCGSVQTIFSLQLPEGDVTLSGDHGADSKKKALAARYCVQDSDRETEGGDCSTSFCAKDSDNELETDEGDCVNVKTGFSLSLSEEDISGRCDHGTDSMKAALAASYCVPDLNHELETEGGDGSNVRTVFPLTFSEDDISPRGDYGTESNKEILTAGDCVKDSDCEPSGGQSNSCGAVLMLPISLSSGNIASAQNCGSEQVETSGSSRHALQKQALAWMARSDCLQGSESIQSVLLLSPHDNLLEAPTEPGSASAVEARESSLLQVSMKTTDLSELLEFSAIILCTQISGDDKDQTEETEVTSLPSGMTPVIASSLVSTPQAGCDQRQKLDCQQSCFTANAMVTSSPEANSGLLLFFEQHRDAHTAINATGSSDSSPKNAERKTLDTPLSQWSDWPILGASIPDDLKQSDDTTLLKYQALRPPTEQERGLICDRSPLENDSLTRTPAQKAVPVETDGASNWSPLAGPNVSNACSLNIKEKGSVLSYARKAVSQLTSSPMSANAGGQESFGTLITCKSQQSRTPGKTCLADSKPPSPFSEERICALEAEGKESLQVKSGPVKHSPPEKIDPEPNPWSPVRKNGRQLGPFDCTKLKYINPGLPT
ncbi:unnamed protein product [Sphagnum tenellum]